MKIVSVEHKQITTTLELDEEELATLLLLTGNTSHLKLREFNDRNNLPIATSITLPNATKYVEIYFQLLKAWNENVNR